MRLDAGNVSALGVLVTDSSESGGGGVSVGKDNRGDVRCAVQSDRRAHTQAVSLAAKSFNGVCDGRAEGGMVGVEGGRFLGSGLLDVLETSATGSD